MDVLKGCTDGFGGGVIDCAVGLMRMFDFDLRLGASENDDVVFVLVEEFVDDVPA